MDSIRPIVAPQIQQTASTPAADSAPGPQDSVSLGSGVPDRNCWDPRKWQRPTVRAEVGSQLDKLASSECTGIRHTTRDMPRVRTPQAPREFAAGRFAVNFRDKSGTETGYIFETEQGPGHLGKVIPGKTEIPGGYISILADPKDAFGEATRLNEAEVDRLLDRVHDRFRKPTSQEQADSLQSVLDYGYAIRYSGLGTGAVQAAHAQRLG